MHFINNDAKLPLLEYNPDSDPLSENIISSPSNNYIEITDDDNDIDNDIDEYILFKFV